MICLSELGRIRSELIDSLSDYDVISPLNYLRKMNVLNDQEMKTVEGKMTSKDRARCLIDTVMEKGERGSSLMVDYLTERHPDLCWTLGLTPTSAWISEFNMLMKFPHYVCKVLSATTLLKFRCQSK